MNRIIQFFGAKPNRHGGKKRLFRLLLQSALVMLFVLAGFLLVRSTLGMVAVASLGASAFIAFSVATPKPVARSRNIVWGYIFATVFGNLFSFLANLFAVEHSGQAHIVLCSIAVFFCTTCMLLFDMPHPPAVAFCIYLVFEGQPLRGTAAAWICLVLMLFMRFVLLRLLKHDFEFGTAEEETLPEEAAGP